MTSYKKIICALVIQGIVSGCGTIHEPSEVFTDNNQQSVEEKEHDDKLSKFKEKNNAISFDDITKNSSCSAEIMDKSQGKVLLYSVMCNDIFYDEGTLLLYAETWKREKFFLDITEEQYEQLKPSINDYLNTVDIAFELKSIKPLFPTVSAYFEFSNPNANNFVDTNDEYVSFDDPVISGKLIDIMIDD